MLVIFLLCGSGDSCRYYVFHLVSPLYCGVRTTETILDQLCVSCELAHIFHPILFLLKECDCVGLRLVLRQRVVSIDHCIVSECATAIQQKDNEHALALTEMRNAKERDLQ